MKRIFKDIVSNAKATSDEIDLKNYKNLIAEYEGNRKAARPSKLTEIGKIS